MSSTASEAGGLAGPAEKLGFESGMVVQELGWDEDADEQLRQGIESVTGSELVDDEHDEVVDAVILWWRDDDGDLVDALVDAKTDLVDGGVIWLLTPKVGLDGHVEPADIADGAPTAGLSTTTSRSVTDGWSGTRLVAPKSQR